MKKIILLALILAACAPQQRQIDPDDLDAARKIRVMNADPPGAVCEELAALEAQDGGGCGLFGTPGTHSGAILELKYQAWKAGGNVAIIDNVREAGRMIGKSCLDQSYVISARVLKCDG